MVLGAILMLAGRGRRALAEEPPQGALEGLRLADAQRTAAGTRDGRGIGSPYEINDKLRDVEIIGLGQVEAPEDVIFDLDDNHYTGTRHGDI